MDKDLNSFVHFFVEPVNLNSPGFLKLLAQIQITFKNSRILSTPDDIAPGEQVIPVGIIAGLKLMRSPVPKKAVFLIDSTVLALWSGLKFQLRRGKIFHAGTFRLFLRLMKYIPLEWRVVRAYEHVFVVSPFDAGFLKSRFRIRHVEAILNGVALPERRSVVKKPFDFSMGILSYWGAGAFEDVDWFIQQYYPRLKRLFPGLRLIAAGRNASEELRSYFKKNGVEFLGEVGDLHEFFSRIDFYITTLRQESGILNKVLDAFAYEKVVVGLEGNMHAFAGLKNGYLTYRNFDELVKAIECIRDHPDRISEMTGNARQYIISNHDWDHNYQHFYDLLAGVYNDRV
jgi:glycosyltransferase involved in cell wall biosynthesis